MLANCKQSNRLLVVLIAFSASVLSAGVCMLTLSLTARNQYFYQNLGISIAVLLLLFGAITAHQIKGADKQIELSFNTIAT